MAEGAHIVYADEPDAPLPLAQIDIDHDRVRHCFRESLSLRFHGGLYDPRHEG